MGCMECIGVLRYAQDDSKCSEQPLIRGLLSFLPRGWSNVSAIFSVHGVKHSAGDGVAAPGLA